MEFEASSDSSEEFIPQRIEVQADIENAHSSIKEASISATYEEFIRKAEDIQVANLKETKNVKYGSELQKYMKEIVTAHDQLIKKTSTKRLSNTDQLLKYLHKCDSLTKKIQELKDLLNNEN